MFATLYSPWLWHLFITGCCGYVWTHYVVVHCRWFCRCVTGLRVVRCYTPRSTFAPFTTPHATPHSPPDPPTFTALTGFPAPLLFCRFHIEKLPFTWFPHSTIATPHACHRAPDVVPTLPHLFVPGFYISHLHLYYPPVTHFWCVVRYVILVVVDVMLLLMMFCEYVLCLVMFILFYWYMLYIIDKWYIYIIYIDYCYLFIVFIIIIWWYDMILMIFYDIVIYLLLLFIIVYSVCAMMLALC